VGRTKTKKPKDSRSGTTKRYAEKMVKGTEINQNQCTNHAPKVVKNRRGRGVKRVNYP